MLRWRSMNSTSQSVKHYASVVWCQGLVIPSPQAAQTLHFEFPYSELFTLSLDNEHWGNLVTELWNEITNMGMWWIHVTQSQPLRIIDFLSNSRSVCDCMPIGQLIVTVEFRWRVLLRVLWSYSGAFGRVNSQFYFNP